MLNAFVIVSVFVFLFVIVFLLVGSHFLWANVSKVLSLKDRLLDVFAKYICCCHCLCCFFCWSDQVFSSLKANGIKVKIALQGCSLNVFVIVIVIVFVFVIVFRISLFVLKSKVAHWVTESCIELSPDCVWTAKNLKKMKPNTGDARN